jgi:hypothetical protein
MTKVIYVCKDGAEFHRIESRYLARWASDNGFRVTAQVVGCEP